MKRNTNRRSFGGVPRSLTVASPGSVDRSFPTRRDYLQYLESEHSPHSAGDSALQSELFADVQRHWHGLGQNGCRFAQLLSHDPLSHGWGTIVVSDLPEEPNDVEFWQELQSEIDAGARNPSVLVLSLLFPSVKNESDLVKVLQALLSQPGWTVELQENEEYPGLTLVSLRFQLPSLSVLSWVIGFGPLPSFPLTRQAPFVELTFMLKPKGQTPRPHPSLNPDTSTAHVADIPVPILHRDDYDRMIRGSQRNKGIILEDYGDPRAKAKISFSITSAAASLLFN